MLYLLAPKPFPFFFFLKDPPPTEIYPLPLPAALPICMSHPAGTLDRRGCATQRRRADDEDDGEGQAEPHLDLPLQRECHAASSTSRTLRAMPSGVDRKSTRLNSSHSQISYAVFCLKKK